MPHNHAAAIIRWRTQLNELGFSIEDQSAPTISTMLFGCNRWLATHEGPDDQYLQINAIKAELETWLAKRGLTFYG